MQQLDKLKKHFLTREFFLFLVIGCINTFNGTFIAWLCAFLSPYNNLNFNIGYIIGNIIAYIMNSYMKNERETERKDEPMPLLKMTSDFVFKAVLGQVNNPGFVSLLSGDRKPQFRF